MHTNKCLSANLLNYLIESSEVSAPVHRSVYICLAAAFYSTLGHGICAATVTYFKFLNPTTDMHRAQQHLESLSVST